MKLFVYEYITSGALADQDLPKSLAHEGNEMLNAVIQDCNELPHISMTIMRDNRLAAIKVIDNNAHHQCHLVSSVTEYQQLWQQCLDDTEAVLIIAPETNNVLTDLHHQAASQNKVILGCQSGAIATATNKLTCYKQLEQHNIDVSDTQLASHWLQEIVRSDRSYIAKPIDGAGCIETYIFDTIKELNHYLVALSDSDKDKIVIQPYIEGIHASMSLLFSDNDVDVLTINEQKIERNNNVLHFTGCHINSITEATFSRSLAYELAKKVQHTLPGLWGFVGIDFIINGTSAVIVDINPRITSSYSGLKNAIKTNPMALLLQMKETEQASQLHLNNKQAANQSR